MPLSNEEFVLRQQILAMRDRDGMTFEAIAQALNLGTRQVARSKYFKEIQRRTDEAAYDQAFRGGVISVYTRLSVSMANKIRKEFPQALVEFDANLRTRGDGTEQEPW